MTRKFSHITCIYYDNHNYIPARFTCPDLEIDDVILPLTTNQEYNYEIISELIVDFAFATYCSKAMNSAEFSKDNLKFKRCNWKLLEFKEIINESKSNKEDKEPTPSVPDEGKRGNGRKS